jgi:hypothetical protein
VYAETTGAMLIASLLVGLLLFLLCPLLSLSFLIRFLLSIMLAPNAGNQNLDICVQLSFDRIKVNQILIQQFMLTF